MSNFTDPCFLQDFDTEDPASWDAVTAQLLKSGLDEYIKDQIDSLLDGIKERVDSVETNVLEDEMSKVSSSSKAAATGELSLLVAAAVSEEDNASASVGQINEIRIDEVRVMIDLYVAARTHTTSKPHWRPQARVRPETKTLTEDEKGDRKDIAEDDKVGAASEASLGSDFSVRVGPAVALPPGSGPPAPALPAGSSGASFVDLDSSDLDLPVAASFVDLRECQTFRKFEAPLGKECEDLTTLPAFTAFHQEQSG